MRGGFFSLLCSPGKQAKPSSSPSSSPPPFPVKAAYWETPAPPPPFPWMSPPGTPLLWREGGRVRQACSREASVMCSSQRRWRWAYWVLLRDLPVTSVNSLTVLWVSASLQAPLSFPASLGLACLVSAWVLRGERDLWHLRHPLTFSRNGTGSICAFLSGVIVRV